MVSTVEEVEQEEQEDEEAYLPAWQPVGCCVLGWGLLAGSLAGLVSLHLHKVPVGPRLAPCRLNR